MAMLMEQHQQQQQQQQQQAEYKHYCRVCKKGFGCGRALGGHMRAHGIGDEAGGGQRGDNYDDDSGEEWDDKSEAAPSGSRRMYALRANPNRLKSCRVCENCGEEFASWKSFLEHGRCSSDDAGGSVLSSPRSDGDEDAVCAAWSKGKRSRRAKGAAVTTGGGAAMHRPSSEEEDLANCLVMLSAARFDPMAVVAEAEESCASASKEDDSIKRHHHHHNHYHHMADRADPFSAASNKHKVPAAPATTPAPRGMFECKACKKVFTSHQALGGHRASHKKVKGCFAAKIDDLDESAAPPPDEEPGASEAALVMAIVPFDNAPLAVTPLKRKSRVHECSICHRVFASGQALGGHKRCHWLTSNAPDAGSLSKVPVPGAHPHLEPHHLHLGSMFEFSEQPLDLNLPAPTDDFVAARQDIGSSLRLNVPASIYIQTWAENSNNNNNNLNNNNATTSNNNNNNNYYNEPSNPTVDDEADSKVRLAKLSELKDMNVGGESSPWLQVGIGSSTNESSEP